MDEILSPLRRDHAPTSPRSRTNRELEEEIERLRAQAHQRQLQHESLENVLQKTQGDMKAWEKENNKLSAELSTALEQKRDAERERQELAKSLTSQRDTVRVLESRIRDMEQRRAGPVSESKRAELEACLCENEKLVARTTKAENRAAYLEKEVNRLQNAVLNVETALQRRTEESLALTRELQKHTGEPPKTNCGSPARLHLTHSPCIRTPPRSPIGSEVKLVAESEALRKEFETTSLSFEAERQRLERQLDERQTALQKSEDQVKKLSLLVDDLTNQVRGMEGYTKGPHVPTPSKQATAQRIQLETLERQLLELQKRLEHAVQGKQEAQILADEQMQKCERLQKELHQSADETKIIQGQLDAAQKDVSRLQEECEKFEVHLAETRNELSALKKKQGESSKEPEQETHSDALLRMDFLLKDVQNDARDAWNECDNKDLVITELKNEVKDLRERSDSLTMECAQATSQLRRDRDEAKAELLLEKLRATEVSRDAEIARSAALEEKLQALTNTTEHKSWEDLEGCLIKAQEEIVMLTESKISIEEARIKEFEARILAEKDLTTVLADRDTAQEDVRITLAEVNRLERNIQELKTELQSALNMLQEMSQKMENVEKELAEERNKACHDANAGLASFLLQQQTDEWRDVAQKAQKEAHQFQDEALRAEALATQSKMEADVAQDALQAALAKEKENTEVIEEIRGRLRSAEAALAEQQDQVEQYKKQVSLLEESMAGGDLALVELEDARNQIDSLKKDVLASSQQISGLTTVHQKALSDLEIAQGTITSLEGNLTEATEKCDEVEVLAAAQAEEWTEKLHKAEGELKTAALEHLQTRGQLCDLRAQMAKAEEKHTEFVRERDETIKELTDEIHSLHETLNESGKEQERLTQRLETMETEMNEQIRRFVDLVNEITEDRNCLQRRIETERGNNEGSRRSLGELQTRVVHAEETAQLAQAERMKVEETYDALQSSKRALEEEMITKINQLNVLEEECATLRAELEGARKQDVEAKIDGEHPEPEIVTKREADVDELSFQIRKLCEERDAAEAQGEIQQAELEGLKRNLDGAAETEGLMMEEEILPLGAQGGLGAELQNALEDEVDTLRERVRELECIQSIKEAGIEKEAQTGHVEELEEITTLRRELEALERHVCAMETDLVTAYHNHDTLEACDREVQTSTDDEEEVQSVHNRLHEVEDSLSEREQRLEDLKNELSESNLLVKKQKDEMEILLHKATAGEEEVRRLQEQVAHRDELVETSTRELNEMAEELRAAYDAMGEKVQRERVKYARARSEQEGKQEALTFAEAEASVARGEVERLTAELQQVTNESANIKIENEQLRERMLGLEALEAEHKEEEDPSDHPAKKARLSLENEEPLHRDMKSTRTPRSNKDSKASVHVLRRDLSSVRDQLRRREEEVKRMSERYDAMVATNLTLRRKISTLETKLFAASGTRREDVTTDDVPRSGGGGLFLRSKAPVESITENLPGEATGGTNEPLSPRSPRRLTRSTTPTRIPVPSGTPARRIRSPCARGSCARRRESTRLKTPNAKALGSAARLRQGLGGGDLFARSPRPKPLPLRDLEDKESPNKSMDLPLSPRTRKRLLPVQYGGMCSNPASAPDSPITGTNEGEEIKESQARHALAPVSIVEVAHRDGSSRSIENITASASPHIPSLSGLATLLEPPSSPNASKSLNLPCPVIDGGTRKRQLSETEQHVDTPPTLKILDPQRRRAADFLTSPRLCDYFPKSPPISPRRLELEH